MNLKTMFTITAVFSFATGLAALLAPAAMLTAASESGLATSSAALMSTRFIGVYSLGLGLIAWLVRSAEASTARNGVALGFTIYFALHALTSLYGQFTDTSTSVHWVAASLQGLLAAGFFVTARAGVSSELATQS